MKIVVALTIGICCTRRIKAAAMAVTLQGVRTMTIILRGVIKYPSLLGLVYEEDTKEKLAIALIRQMEIYEDFAEKRGERQLDNYKQTMTELKRMLSEVMILEGSEKSADDCRESLIVWKAVKALEDAGRRWLHT